MPDIIFTEYLKTFGLTGQEAIIYEVLLKKGVMTGYEISKETGISRSNVYGSLAGLVDKGAAYLIEGDAARYIPVEIEKFCDNTLKEMRRVADYLEKHAPEKVSSNIGYITIQGSRHIRDMIRDMLKRCEMRLYFMANKSLIEEFEKDFIRLIAEGKKIVLLTNDYELDGAIIYHTEPEDYQIRFIIDSSYVLTGELKDSDSDNCLYSGQKNLVAVMKEALKNRIKLIELKEES